MTETVHQLLHGYRRGHELLAASVQLDSHSADLSARLSDISGAMLANTPLEPYLTAYPLSRHGFYALAKTWLDRQAPRAGCVLTHTLLIPSKLWGETRNPQKFDALFALPANRDELEQFRSPLALPDELSEVAGPLSQPFQPATVEFVAKYFGDGRRPIVWFRERDAAEIFWRIVRALWPRLRRQFACCTFSLQPRVLEDRPFDLMFAPSAAFSRFSKLPKESVIEDSAFNRHEVPDRELEPWYREYARHILGDDTFDGSLAGELKEFGSQLGEDSTSIRKLFLIRELRHRVNDSSTAAAALMDVVEAVAPLSHEGIAYKNEIAVLALKAAKNNTSAEEALTSCYLFSERLTRPAYSNVDAKISNLLATQVARWTEQHPDLALRIGARHLVPETHDELTAFARGALEGLRQVADLMPQRLVVLHQFPQIAPHIISQAPSVALGYLKGAGHDAFGGANNDLIEWIAAIRDTEPRRRVRSVLLPHIVRDDQTALIEELLRDIADVDVVEVLETITKSTESLLSPVLLNLLCTHLSGVHPKGVRNWARQASPWIRGAATIVAASYAATEAGLVELLGEAYSEPLQQALVVSAFLEGIGGAQFPLWLRNHAHESADFLVPLLGAGPNAPPEVNRILEKIGREVRDTPIARETQLVPIIGWFLDTQSSDGLLSLVMRSAITEYIEGTLDWKTCQKWQSSSWAETWLERVPTWEIESVVFRTANPSEQSWRRAWEWLARAPRVVYARSPEILSRLLEGLTSVRNMSCDQAVVESWLEIIRKSFDSADTKTQARVCAFTLNYAFQHMKYPVSALVVRTFGPVYSAVIESSNLPETRILFSGFEWDRGKDLRGRLVDSYWDSKWPPGDLALAANGAQILKKVFKRVRRKWRGEEYVEEMLRDLRSRTEPSAENVWKVVSDLAEHPDFYEPWD